MLIYFLFFGLGASVYAFKKQVFATNHYIHALRKTEEPRLLRLQLMQELPSNTVKQRFYGELLYMEESTMSGQLLITVDSLARPLHVGDRIVVYTSIRSINPAMNPGAFDYAAYLAQKGVFGQVYIREHTLLDRQHDLESLDWSKRVAAYLARKLEQSPVDSGSTALLKALILGQKQDLTARFKERFRAAGVMHVLALSGLHVGILLLLLRGITQPVGRLPYGPYIQMAVVVLGLWSFAFVAGLSPSICRAVTMFSFFSIGWLTKRRSGKYTSLFASAFVLLIWDPRLLFDVGFQLSYAAVFAILSWQPLLASFWSTRWWVFRKVRDILSVSIAAQLGVFPLTVFYFHEFPGLFLLGNLLVLPLLPLVLVMGIALLVLQIIDLGQLGIPRLFDGLVSLLHDIVTYLSSFDHFVFRHLYVDIPQVIAAYVVLYGGLFYFLPHVNKRKWRLFTPTKPNWSLHFMLFALLGTWFFLSERDVKNQEGFFILHQYGDQVAVVAHDDYAEVLAMENAVQDSLFDQKMDRWRVYDMIKRKRCSLRSLSASFFLDTHRVTRLTNDAVVDLHQKAQVLWLSGTPRVNIDRVLDSIQPHQIILDGSSPYWYSKSWSQAAQKKGVLLLDTKSIGALAWEKEANPPLFKAVVDTGSYGDKHAIVHPSLQ